MEARTFTIARRGTGRADHPWLAALLAVLDRRLRLRYGVREYTRSADCVFRMHVGASTAHVLLPDGTCVRAGDRVIILHLWNEQVPAFPRQGPTLGWALRITRLLDVSLRELAAYLATRTDLDDVAALYAEVSSGSPEESAQIARIMGRYGFERAALQRPRSVSERLHRLGENILIAMMVLVHNPAALRAGSLWRDRTPLVLSRRVLQRRYGLERGRAAQL